MMAAIEHVRVGTSRARAGAPVYQYMQILAKLENEILCAISAPADH